jgi:hypothetical protein
VSIEKEMVTNVDYSALVLECAARNCRDERVILKLNTVKVGYNVIKGSKK